MKKFKLSVLMGLFCLSTTILAATNPISWSVDGQLPSIVYPGRSYPITYTITSNLPFTMVNALQINKSANPTSEFSYTDNCTNVKLAPHQSCTVIVTMTPTTAGSAKAQLSIAGYDHNQLPLPVLSTQVQGSGLSSVYGTVTQNLPTSLGVGLAGSYGFSFTNNSGATLTSVSLNLTQTSGTPAYTTTNCGSTLENDSSCQITGTYTPSSSTPNLQTVSATLNYHSGSSVNVSTSTTIPASNGLVASFIGNEYLPPISVPTTPAAYPPPPAGSSVGVLFTNTGPGAATISSSPAPSITTNQGVFTQFPGSNGDSCTGATLQVGAACQLAGSLNTSALSPGTTATVTASVTYSQNGTHTTSLSSSTDILATLPTARTIKFVNHCGFDVWYSMNGAQETGSCNSSGVGCPTGTSCNKEKGTCFWNNYPLLSGASSTNLLHDGGSATQTIPAYSTDPTVQWSGNFSASLGCTGNHTTGSCAQAGCSNQGGASCSPGIGFNQPATQAEFTMLLNGADSYDVETINGFHIPISVTPLYSYSPQINATPNNYTCNDAAAKPAASGFGVCDWTNQATPPSTYYNWVTTNNNLGCGSCPSSSTTQVCGLDSNFNYGCGKFKGYWSADQVCGSSNVPTTVRAAFNCDVPLSGLSPAGFFPAGYTLYDLMACKVPKNDPNPAFNSCYKTYPSSQVPSNNQLQCCGCIDWWTLPGIGSNSNANTTSCTKPGKTSPQTDPVWNQHIQSTLEWMKKACPSAYVYPFDDMTSTFTCTNTLPGSPNSTSYIITFCPGNDTGLPAGKNASAEGRS